MILYLKESTLDIPPYIDTTVVNKWIPKDSKIIRQIQGTGNICIAYEYKGIFSFVRFFVLGDKTCCSVDFQSHDQEQMIEKLIDILEEKFSF